MPLDDIPYLFETFNRKQHLIISRTGELRDSYPSEYRYLTARNTSSLFAVPFEDESTFSGYIGIDNPNINQDTIRLLDSIAYNIANEIKKRRLYERLEYEATHDDLSGLLNRDSFVHFRDDLVRSGTTVSCGIVAGDINDLKQLNRDYGQRKGDLTITEVSSIMASYFAGGSIFRLSGDEFIIVSLESGYEEFMEQVRKMEWALDNRTPNGVSLGCTWEEHLTDFDRLMRHAEELMLVNKQLYYKDSSQERKHYSPEDLNRLLQGMEDGCYHLYLQPKYNPLTGKVCSAEALVRYRSAGAESRQPLNFVPLLEKSKLIRYLDFYMLEQVFKLLTDWKKRGRELIPVSVNFSRITLLERDLFQVLTDMQKKYDIPPRLVMIEITESIGDIERKVIESIGSKLREAGFRISLDDFGANYANMSILSIMQFDEVKLDKSLMDDLVVNRTNQTVVKCIIEMCHSLQVECVAEGVENQEQLELLTSFGCTAIQGYYYSRPLDIEEFERI